MKKTSVNLKLQLLPKTYCISKISTNPGPRDLLRKKILAFIRSPDEISIVQQCLKGDMTWRALLIKGTFNFNEAGILARVIRPLGKAGIGILAFSTFSSDIVLVQTKDLTRAIKTLRQARIKIIHKL